MVLILLLGNQISSLLKLLQVLSYALVHSNLVALLGGLLVGGLLKRLAHRKLPLVQAVVFCIVVVVPVGCLLVQALLMAIGIVVPQHFWREYLVTLRVSVPLATVFGMGDLCTRRSVVACKSRSKRSGKRSWLNNELKNWQRKPAFVPWNHEFSRTLCLTP